MSTKVKVMCMSKKESASHRPETPINTAIELQVDYNGNSIYYQMSGGTNIMLNTVNQAAADEFVIGKSYDILISASEE